MKKSLLILAAASAVIFAACNSGNEGTLTPEQADSIKKAYADSIETVRRADSLRIADSLNAALVADSLRIADSLANIKPVSGGTVAPKPTPKPTPTPKPIEVSKPAETPKNQPGMRGKSDQDKAEGSGGMRGKSDQDKAASKASGTNTGSGMRGKSDQDKAAQK